MTSLQETSLQVLLNNQDSSGAFLASPNFTTYKYAWLRDGSFCAYALDLWGESDRAAFFYQWVFAVLEKYQNKINYAIWCYRKGVELTAEQYFHSRFTIKGEEIPGHWGHHQLDGLGTWLWACCNHFRQQGKNPDKKQHEMLVLVRNYLITFWQKPCSDCWEEHEDQVHTYSLAAVSAGLEGLGQLLCDEIASSAARKIRKFILASAIDEGHLVKSLNNPSIDANLIALATPFQTISYQSPVMQKTLHLIIKQLASQEGGLKRYATDTYFGGGEWILLSAWLGWAACEAGDNHTARKQLNWIESQADIRGFLPEQVPHHLNSAKFYKHWVERWGPIASPLLWSHAQYLILFEALKRSCPTNDQPSVYKP
jgi:GH15 family glucan-1,4-alpha-glucosidase